MRRRAGRPTVAQTVARTAVIAGTATVVSGAVAGSQQEKAADQQQAAAQQAAAQQAQIDAAVEQAAAAAQQAAGEQATSAPVPAPAITDETVAQLQKMSELRAAGVLSEEEFTTLKAKLLNL